jgi:hypothetical protein
MLKVKSIVSVQVNGKDYEFYCDPDSPLKDALEGNKQINAFLLGRLQQMEQSQTSIESKSE